MVSQGCQPRGNAEARYNLGVIYEQGDGVLQNCVEAVRWYHLAAEQGYAAAQSNLGAMYDRGECVPQNYREALRWYRKAVDQGNATAQYNIGAMYATGHGVPQDDVTAHLWFSLSAAQGDEDAAKNRDLIALRMTLAQISEAQKLEREWKLKPQRHQPDVDIYSAAYTECAVRRLHLVGAFTLRACNKSK